MSTKPAGASATANVLRPRPDAMGDYLPLWNARNAHIVARDNADAAIYAMRPELDSAQAATLRGEMPPHQAQALAAKLQEQIDVRVLHDAEATSLTEQMQALQYDPTT